MSRYVKDSNGNWHLSSGLPQIDDELDSNSENPIQNKVVSEEITTLTNQAANKILYFTGIDCTAITGNFTSYSNEAITAKHVVSECVFANPAAITTDVTWTTTNGSVTLNGTCITATTVNLVLVKKDN